MALKYGNDSVTNLVFNGNTVAELVKDNTIVWERPGTYVTGTLPTGVASLSCTLTGSSEPTVASLISSLGAIPISNNGTIHHKDKLGLSVTSSNYWTASVNSPQTVNFKTTTTFTGADYVSAARNERSVSFTKNTGIASVTITYTNLSGTANSSQTLSSSGSVSGVWQGASISWTSTAANYYTSPTSGSSAAGTSSVSISPTASYLMRTITITKNTGVASISVTYTNSSGSRVTETKTSSTTVSAWSGQTVTWTATAASGYEMDTASGTISSGSSAGTIAPTATATAPQKGWYDHPEGTTMSCSWTNTQWISNSQSNTKYPASYTYLNFRSQIRVSGSFTANNQTVNFSNVTLNSDKTYTAVAQVNFDFGVAQVAYTLYMKGRNYLDCYVGCSGTAMAKVAASVSVTSIQVYTYPSSMTVSAPQNLGMDDYYVNIKNNNSVSVTVLFKGYALWGDSYEFQSGFWDVSDSRAGGRTLASGASHQYGAIDFSQDAYDAGDDASLNTLEEFRVAFFNDDYLAISSYVEYNL